MATNPFDCGDGFSDFDEDPLDYINDLEDEILYDLESDELDIDYDEDNYLNEGGYDDYSDDNTMEE